MQSNESQPMLGFAWYLLHAGFLISLLLDPEDGQRYVPLKCQLTFTRQHGVISQKIEFFTHRMSGLRPGKQVSTIQGQNHKRQDAHSQHPDQFVVHELVKLRHTSHTCKSKFCK
jgi:hypothetical protein